MPVVYVTLNTINGVVGQKEEWIQPLTTRATTKWLICGQEDQIVDYQTFVRDTPFKRCLHYVTMHLWTIGIERKNPVCRFCTIEKIEIGVSKLQTKF